MAEWYYFLDNEKKGPVPEDVLVSSVKNGGISENTMIWTEGMQDWVPYCKSQVSKPVQQNSAIQPPPLGGEVKWYYSLNGKRVGPVDAIVISDLLSKGVLNTDSLVWKDGFNNWIPISQSTLKVSLSGPPPLSGLAINNALIWIVAFVPIIGTLLQYFISGATQIDAKNLWFITLALNIILCVIDDRILRNAGHNTKQFGGWAWLVPVYLYKRSKALSQSLAYFITWIACFVVSFFL